MKDEFDYNESDVREEIVVPFLAALGYKKGSSADINREKTLSYGRAYLGRKKDSDPLLRGRADYVLSVAGAGRWVLEIKSMQVEINADDIEQSISYARHPEVSAYYSAITNGKRFIVFSLSQNSSDRPIVDIEITSPEQLAQRLVGLLSPSAIRRDCSPPIVDLDTPLALGFRSQARIHGGTITYNEWRWWATHLLPPKEVMAMDELIRKLKGFRSTISEGKLWRDSNSRIMAQLVWNAPHVDVIQFSTDKGLMEAKYVSLDESISQNPKKPTLFDVVDGFILEKGEQIFDIHRWENVQVGIRTSMSYTGQAAGYLIDNMFIGSFQVEYQTTFPDLPLPINISWIP
jgi:hypothetical protein